jgi:hypothetical protein
MASQPPDVIAYTLEEARLRLAAAGWSVSDVVFTSPPRRTLRGPSRVVRQRIRDDGLLALVVCGERADAERG